jgi:hypothetical protein
LENIFVLNGKCQRNRATKSFKRSVNEIGAEGEEPENNRRTRKNLENNRGGMTRTKDKKRETRRTLEIIDPV